MRFCWYKYLVFFFILNNKTRNKNSYAYIYALQDKQYITPFQHAIFIKKNSTPVHMTN